MLAEGRRRLWMASAAICQAAMKSAIEPVRCASAEAVTQDDARGAVAAAFTQ